MAELLATVADLQAFMQRPDLDAEAAATALRITSGLVRGYTGQLFDRVVDEELELDGSGTEILLLPELPVSAVSAVAEDPRGVYATTALLEDVDYEWNVDGILKRLGGRWVRRARWYQVTYSHGFEVTPDDVNGIVLRVAARGIENPTGLRSETIGGYSYSLGGSDAVGLVLFGPDLRELDEGGYRIGGGRPRSGTPAAP